MRDILMAGEVPGDRACLVGCEHGATGVPATGATAGPADSMATPHGGVGTQLNQGKFAAIRKSTSPGTVVYARFKGLANIGKKMAEAREWATKKGYTIIGPPACVYQADFLSAPDKSVIEVQWPSPNYARIKTGRSA